MMAYYGCKLHVCPRKFMIKSNKTHLVPNYSCKISFLIEIPHISLGLNVVNRNKEKGPTWSNT